MVSPLSLSLRRSTLGGRGNKAIIPLMVQATYPLTTDIDASFKWDTFSLHATTTSTTAVTIPGASELRAIWELMRIHKVEVTILPFADSLDYNNQTLSSGSTNIPFVYTAIDYVDPDGSRGFSQIRQNPTVRVDLLNKPIRRTVYPRLEGSNGIVDVGVNRRNLFSQSDVSSSQKWNGFMLYIDNVNVNWTYGNVRVEFKVFFECMNSK